MSLLRRFLTGKPISESGRERSEKAASQARAIDEAQDKIAAQFEEIDSAIEKAIALLNSHVLHYEKTALAQFERVRARSLKTHGGLENRITVMRQHTHQISDTLCNPRTRPHINPPFAHNAHRTITTIIPPILHEIEKSVPSEMHVFMQLPIMLITPPKSEPDWIQGAAFPLIPGDVSAIGGYEKIDPTNLPRLRYPYGLDVHPITHHVYLVDQENNVIRVFDKDLHYLFGFGKPDSKNSPGIGQISDLVSGSLAMPWGIAISADGERIAVTSVGSSEIHLFNRTHQRIRIISRASHPQTALQYIHMLAFDRDGFIYVADTSAGDLIKLTPSGDYLKHIIRAHICTESDYTEAGTKTRVEKPESVAFNHKNELLVIGQGGNAVHVLNPDGTYLRAIPVDPCASGTPSVDICRGPNGGFAISDWSNGQIRFYGKDGSRLAVMAAHHPLGIAFSPNGCFYYAKYLGHSLVMCKEK